MDSTFYQVVARVDGRETAWQSRPLVLFSPYPNVLVGIVQKSCCLAQPTVFSALLCVECHWRLWVD